MINPLELKDVFTTDHHCDDDDDNIELADTFIGKELCDVSNVSCIFQTNTNLPVHQLPLVTSKTLLLQLLI